MSTFSLWFGLACFLAVVAPMFFLLSVIRHVTKAKVSEDEASLGVWDPRVAVLSSSVMSGALYMCIDV